MHLEIEDLTPSLIPGVPSWAEWGDNSGFTDDWWNGTRPAYAGETYLTARIEGIEVARAELVDDADVGHYVGTPNLDGIGLEIAFFEVTASRRRQGLGGAFAKVLAERYPDRRLFALSEDADDFWASLGWQRHEVESSQLFRPMYLQPK